MRKFALSVLVAVVSFGFVGCASSLERNWGLKEEGLGYISDMKVEKDKHGDPIYYAKIRYCGKEGTILVTRNTYDKLWLEKKVYLKLIAEANRDEASGERIHVATYSWWLTDGSLDRALLVEFKMPQ